MTSGARGPGTVAGGRQPPGVAASPQRFGLAAIALTLVLAGGALWALSERIARDRETRAAFPLVSGKLRVAGPTARLEIARDARGIPHVLAASEVDAWFGLGFVHAQDRLAQMVWLRRLAEGRTAEWIGEAGLPADRLARTVGFARLAEARVPELEADVRVALEAYVAGINARLERIQSGRVAPPVALGRRLEPAVPAPAEGLPMPPPAEPFSVANCLAIGKLVAFASGASHDRAVVMSDLIERLGSIAARPFFPAEPGEGPNSVLALSRDLALRPEVGSVARRAAAPPPFAVAALAGSAWAIPGALSESGAPILVAELSVPSTAPSLLYEAQVRGGALDVSGVTIPGLPVFFAGRNAELAWAAVPLSVASVDLFKETLRMQPPAPAESEVPGDPREVVDRTDGASLHYQNGSRWVPVEERLETIEVGSGESEVLPVRSTRHGPLVDGLIGGRPVRIPLALSWTGAQPGDAVTGLLRLARSSNGAEREAALQSHHEPPIEVVFATRDGEIGLRVAGWLPRRAIPSGLVPVPGRLRAFDWRLPIDRAALPAVAIGGPASQAGSGAGASAEGPRSGSASDPTSADAPWMVATGTRVDTALSGVSIEWLWQDAGRPRRIERLVAGLVEGGGIELGEASSVQNDVAANVDPALLAALIELAGEPPLLSPEAMEVLDLLRRWDGQADAASRGTPAFELLLSHLVRALLDPAVGAELLDRYLALPGVRPEAVLGGILIAAARGDTRRTWADPARVSAAVRDSLRRTWMSLSYRLGHNRERWTWGRLQTLSFRPFESFGYGALDPGFALARTLGLGSSLAAPGDDRAVDASAGPFGVAGRAASVARTESDRETFVARRASTYRLAVDLASTNRVLTSLSPGQSEHPGHAHFADGVAGWRAGTTSPLVTSPLLLQEAAIERLVLEPPG